MITQVTYERVFNLGGYESERISATATVEPTDETDGVLIAYDEARAAVADEHARTLAARQQIAQQPNGGAAYDPPASDKQRAYIATLQDKLEWNSEQMSVYASEQGIDLVAMTKSQSSTFIDGLKRLADKDAAERGILRWSERMVGKPNQPTGDGGDIPF